MSKKKQPKKKKYILFPVISVLGVLKGSLGSLLIALACFIVWRRLLSKQETSVQKPASSKQTIVSPSVVPEPVVPEPTKSRDDVTVPSKIGNCSIAYKYSVPFDLINEEAALSAAQEGRWELTAADIDGTMYLLSDNIQIGTLTARVDMLRDWIKHDEPYRIYIERLSDEKGCTAFIVFYRDKISHYAWCEQSVVALTSFSIESKQDSIGSLSENDEIYLEEHDTTDGAVVVSDLFGDPIGRLPKKYATRFLEDGARFACVDHIEEDEEHDFALKPYIRIYW